MSNDLKFNINIDEVVSRLDNFKKEISADITKGVGNLANVTHAKVLDMASNNLKSLHKKYTDAVSFSQPEENLWVVTLDESAAWIENDRKSGEMIDDLLKRNYKTSKDGSKYKAIPFNHSTPPSQQSNKAQDLTNFVKQEMKNREISYKKIEYNKNGSPRLGLLHRFNVDNPRMSESQKKNLKGVAVYQTKMKDGSVRRDTMTFRIVSEKQKGSGKWMHPGRKGDQFMQKSFDWALQVWNNEMLPAILKKYE